MTTTVEQAVTIEDARARLAGLQREYAALQNEQSAPALRTNARQRQELGYRLADLAELIKDARIEVLRAEIAVIEADVAGLPDLTATQQAAQQAGDYAINVLPKKHRAELEEAHQKWQNVDLVHRQNEYEHRSRWDKIRERERQIDAIKRGQN